MPYNNTPIAPPTEHTGSVSLPLARVKKIINFDPDVGACSNNAAFTIAVATEMFIQHLVEQSHNVVKAEKRPRRNLQYRDVATAVARIDNLEFLSDVVPRTMTYKAYKEKKAVRDQGSKNGDQSYPISNGQRTLDQMTKHQKYERDDSTMTEEVDDEEMQNGNGAVIVHDSYDDDEEEEEEASSPDVKPQSRHVYDAVRDEIHEGTQMED